MVPTDCTVQPVTAYRGRESRDINRSPTELAVADLHGPCTPIRFFNKTDAESGFLEALPSLQDPIVCEHLPRPREQ